jgi:hypothetical protein
VININGGILANTGDGGVAIAAGAVNQVGTVNLNATSTYTGPTSIDAHTVFVNAANATGSGAVTMNSGTLRGTGSIAGALTVNGGTVAPGTTATPGALTVNNSVALGSSAGFNARIVSSTSFDSLVAGNGLQSVDLGNATLNLDFSNVSHNFNANIDKLYIVQLAPGSSLVSGTQFGNVADGTQVFNGGGNFHDFFLHYDYAPGGGVYIQPVPEPFGLMAIAAGGLAVIGLRRRNRN